MTNLCQATTGCAAINYPHLRHENHKHHRPCRKSNSSDWQRVRRSTSESEDATAFRMILTRAREGC